MKFIFSILACYLITFTFSNTASAAVSQTTKYENDVLVLVNKERAKVKLKPLVMDANLRTVAKKKSTDMYYQGYFDHYSPRYGSPFDMMNTFGIKYSYAGENIAKGQKSPAEVVKAWMNSPGHKANMLNKNYTYIGVGFKGGTKGSLWTQMFIKK